MREARSSKQLQKGFWDLIKNIGIHAGLNRNLSKHIQLSNQFTAYIIGIASFYILVFYRLGFPILGNLTILAALSFIVVFLLNWRGYYLLARFSFVLIINFLVLFYCICLGKEVDMHMIFFALACSPWLLFDMKEWVWISFGLALSLGLFFYFTLNDFIPLVHLSGTEERSIALSFYAVVFIVAGLSVGLMARANNTSEQKLEARTKESMVLVGELQTVNQKLAEQQLLKQLNSELKKAIAEKQQVNSQLERFSYMIAHDLKSPIHGVYGLLELIKMEVEFGSTGQIKEYVNLMSTALKHLSTMIDSVLDYSRTNLHKNTLEEVDLKMLLGEIDHLLFLPSNTEIVIQDGMPLFNTNKFKLLQVFQNLISNAIKYNDKSKVRVEISVEERERFFIFSVKDNGPGIKAEDHARLFRLFETGDETHMDQTGIGLNIIKVLVEEQGGSIHLDSELGIGSIFSFEWYKQ